MDSYTSFSYVYDTFMDQEPYDEWADRVCDYLDRYGLPRKGKKSADYSGIGKEAKSADHSGIGEEAKSADHSGIGEEAKSADHSGIGKETEDAGVDESNIVVDLGCGTGKLTQIMADRGYDMIGIDLSEDMLSIAQERKIESGRDILYTLQDMRDFELYGAAGAMISVGDSVNYLIEDGDLEAMFRCVHRGLLPGGVFVFDFKTIHLYRDVIGESTIAEDRGDCAFIWDNYYDPETCINEYDLAVFVQEEGPDGNLFRRFDEVHQQRGYTPEQLRRAAEEAGLVWVAMQDSVTAQEVDGETERAMAAVRKPF